MWAGSGARLLIGTEQSTSEARATIPKHYLSQTGCFRLIQRLRPMRAQERVVRRQAFQQMAQPMELFRA